MSLLQESKSIQLTPHLPFLIHKSVWGLKLDSRLGAGDSTAIWSCRGHTIRLCALRGRNKVLVTPPKLA